MAPERGKALGACIRVLRQGHYVHEMDICGKMLIFAPK